jgi:hypothetical protein
MERESTSMQRFSGPLVHFYFVPSAPQQLAGSTDDPVTAPQQRAVRPSSLTVRWTREPDGTLAACWVRIGG